LLYDSTGIGAVPYSDLVAREGFTRFVEDGSAPADGTRVGTTWRYVAKNGGPDRRFNNNRQLPVMLYGELGLTSQSGVKELFHCSVPDAVSEVASAIATLKSGAKSRNIDVSFSAPGRDNTLLRVALWSTVVLIGLVALASFDIDYSVARDQTLAEVELQRQREEQNRQQFVLTLNQELRARHLNNATASSSGDMLALRFTNESSKSARRDGVKPFEKSTLLAKVVAPNTEASLCSAGFRGLQVTVNNDPPTSSNLICPFKTTP
jgi:hypothetical protein